MSNAVIFRLRGIKMIEGGPHDIEDCGDLFVVPRLPSLVDKA